ncbi:hypothetical protein BJY01DRAFT_250299 [Aspergillus pseudoustus]|uniref:GS catalytic domain-containing protein n=1 Tax=Aspergillus pseudoustus TaxID=1810923 RepID=A0ABR4JL44_9EURO
MENPTILWEKFILENDKVEFVWIEFMTYTAITLVRMVPVAKFSDMLSKGSGIRYSKDVFQHIPGKFSIESYIPNETFYLVPDLATIYCQAGSDGCRATVTAVCVDSEGKIIPECARARLQGLEKKLHHEFGFSSLVGFEVEVIFMKVKEEGGEIHYDMMSGDHTWSSMTAHDRGFLPVIETIVRALAKVGVVLEQFHTETAPGQWEFVLPPSTPVKAADILLRARNTIQMLAESFQLRATFYPRPWREHFGNGCHTHVSLSPISGGSSKVGVEHFFAGIIQHLPAILAVSLPREESYERVATGIRSCGVQAAWGWENKETPLRRITWNHFEIRSLDGLANPYLAMCTFYAAGIAGLKAGTRLKPSSDGAPTLPAFKPDHSVLLPTTLEDSLYAFEQNYILQEILGTPIAQSYLAVKRAETQHFQQIDTNVKKAWMISRF